MADMEEENKNVSEGQAQGAPAAPQAPQSASMPTATKPQVAEPPPPASAPPSAQQPSEVTGRTEGAAAPQTSENLQPPQQEASQTESQGSQEAIPPATEEVSEQPARVKPGIADVLAGEAKDFNANIQPHLPSELIGGSIPHVYGVESEAVWNAAAQACGTERVHYTYTVEGGRIWYLACPSSVLASNPDSWCPLVAALPDNSEHWDKETVYLYEQEGMASALRWDPETQRMQVFLGATRTILPRMQSMDANFVTINADTARIVKWHNRMLHTEKLSRALIRMLILVGMGVNAIAATILFISVVSLAFIHGNLNKIKTETDEAAQKLMENAAEVMQSDTIRHMARVQNLLDTLAQTNGYLVRYEVSGKRTEWNAIVPTALSDQARQDTKFTDVVGSSVKVYKPTVKREDEDNVRLIGKK